jgi:hypothetical protein
MPMQSPMRMTWSLRMSRRHSKYTTIPIDHETRNKYHAYSYKEKTDGDI